MTNDPNTSGIEEIMANHEIRLSQLEHQVSLLEGRMPLGKWRRVVWWIHSLWVLLVPIVGAIVALLVNEPWGRWVVAVALGVVIGRAGMEFLNRVASGPRPHRSILMEDHRT